MDNYLLVAFYFSNEYQVFQKIMKLEYEIPEGFDSLGKDLVKNLLVGRFTLDQLQSENVVDVLIVYSVTFY